MNKQLAEFIGTFALVFFGCGAAAIGGMGTGAVASNSAAALAASNVSAVPPTTRSLSPPPFFALRRTSHVGTLSSVKTNNMKPPTSVETAGLGQSGGSGCQTTSVIYSLLHSQNCSVPIRAPIIVAQQRPTAGTPPCRHDCLAARVTRTVDAPPCRAR